MMRNLKERSPAQLTTKLRTSLANKYAAVLSLSLSLSLFISPPAMAFTKPLEKTPGFELYDLIVVKGLQGTPGFIAGAWILVQAAQQIKESVWKAGLAAVGGIGLMKAEAIMTSVGVTTQALL